MNLNLKEGQSRISINSLLLGQALSHSPLRLKLARTSPTMTPFLQQSFWAPYPISGRQVITSLRHDAGDRSRRLASIKTLFARASNPLWCTSEVRLRTYKFLIGSLAPPSFKHRPCLERCRHCESDLLLIDIVHFRYHKRRLVSASDSGSSSLQSCSGSQASYYVHKLFSRQQ